MRKLTQTQIEEIIFLKNKDVSLKELSEKFNVTKMAIFYHLSPEFRERLKIYQRKRYQGLSGEDKKKLFANKKEYLRNYQRNRYQNDPKYKKYQSEKSREYQRKKNAK